MSGLQTRSEELLDKAASVFSAVPAASEEIEALKKRINGPLRVAIAGKVKAGKSTLMNALVGERLAATDVGECTKVVTWYQDGHTYQVMLHPTDGGAPSQARFHRDEGALEIDLGGRPAEQIERIEVNWPSSALRAITLIDTPGIDSMTESVANRAFEFLDPQESDTEADAVLYLMRHIHGSDLRLLEAFHDDSVSEPNPVNAVAVLSRCDEIGAGRLDSMASARRIATRLSGDGRIKRLVQVVVPVAGLLGETAASLTEWEFGALKKLAEVPRKELEPFMLSADRFINAKPETPLTSMERQALLKRFGLFGIRISLAMLRRGVAESSAQLSEELEKRSGVKDLYDLLTTLFVERADVLKARSALLSLERLCEEHPQADGAAQLALEVEGVIAGAHPFAELRTIAAVRGGQVDGVEADLIDLERTLGASGTSAQKRLGLSDDASADEVRNAVIAELGRWQRQAENPFSGHELANAARTAIRTLEGLLAV